jgi:hypothetical protein
LSVVFFTDRDLGLQFPRTLREAGRHERPLIAKVYRPSPAELMGNPAAPGRIELWYPTRPLKPPRRTGRKA